MNNSNIRKKIVEWLVTNEVITEADSDLYEYAIYSILIKATPLLLILIIGGLMGTLVEGVSLILPYMSIRKYSGGYHAKNYRSCFVLSCVLIIFCMLLARYIRYSIWISIVVIISIISLSMFSPVDSENRRLKTEEKEKYKEKAVRIAITFTAIHILLLLIRWNTMAVNLAIGIILSAGLQLPYIVKGLYKRISKTVN